MNLSWEYIAYKKMCNLFPCVNIYCNLVLSLWVKTFHMTIQVKAYQGVLLVVLFFYSIFLKWKIVCNHRKWCPCWSMLEILPSGLLGRKNMYIYTLMIDITSSKLGWLYLAHLELTGRDCKWCVFVLSSTLSFFPSIIPYSDFIAA